MGDWAVCLVIRTDLLQLEVIWIVAHQCARQTGDVAREWSIFLRARFRREALWNWALPTAESKRGCRAEIDIPMSKDAVTGMRSLPTKLKKVWSGRCNCERGCLGWNRNRVYSQERDIWTVQLAVAAYLLHLEIIASVAFELEKSAIRNVSLI
jgi:hypothetical protein